MSKSSLLTLSFIEKRPFSAAQTLAELPPDEAATYLNTIPSRYAVLALSHMDKWSSAAAIKQMAAPNAAAALREMDQISAAAILRLLKREKRSELLDLVPERSRQKLAAVVSFPDDAVGAHMQTAIISVPQEVTVDKAIAAFKKLSAIQTDTVYVVDGTGMFRGIARASVLLHASPKSRVGDLVDAEMETLSSRARVAAIASLTAWDDYPELPVVNRRKQLIGSLTRKAVRDSGIEEAPMIRQSTSLASGIFGAYFTSAVGLGRLLIEMPSPLSRSDGTRK